MTNNSRNKHPKPYSMNNFKPVAVLGGIAFLAISFQNLDKPEPSFSEDRLHLPTEDLTPTFNNGKVKNSTKKAEVFEKSDWKNLGFPVISEEVALALKHQKRVLRSSKFRDGQAVGNLHPSRSDFGQVIDLLLQSEGSQPADLQQSLEAHQVWGSDKRGNVRFTGYYTPVVKAKAKKTNKYRHAIYAYPKDWDGPKPSRSEIEAGALDGLGLELAYAANPVDISIMQLQGSGYVDFVDTGERKLFKYAGHNRHRYRNIQRFFKNRKDLKIGDVTFAGIKRFLKKRPELVDSILHSNPSYTFFSPTEGLVKGAGRVPLMKAISVAADPKYFPAGSVLLASMPVTENGKVTHHEYRILLPQDVGGAIKGAGRIDVYCGVGAPGERMASRLHHYGKIWLLTPKRNEQIAGL